MIILISKLYVRTRHGNIETLSLSRKSINTIRITNKIFHQHKWLRYWKMYFTWKLFVDVTKKYFTRLVFCMMYFRTFHLPYSSMYSSILYLRFSFVEANCSTLYSFSKSIRTFSFVSSTHLSKQHWHFWENQLHFAISQACRSFFIHQVFRVQLKFSLGSIPPLKPLSSFRVFCIRSVTDLHSIPKLSTHSKGITT